MTSLIDRKDASARHVALGALATLASAPEMAAAMRPYLSQVVACLSDSDPSVKKRAVDVLVAVCDASTVEGVVAQLLGALPASDATVRAELVVKVAILAERYPPSMEWCDIRYFVFVT
jgi:AP-2 complex subunit alpha